MTDSNFEIKTLDTASALTMRMVESLENFTSRLKRFSARLRFMKYEIQFGERDEDIYVVSFLKSGTTWMQQTLYQLTTSGEMNFKHIYDVSPWLRNLSFTSSPLPNLPSPRIIKSHDPYPLFKKVKKGKFIFLLRNGMDVAASLYHHRKDYNDNKITFDKSFDLSFVQSGQENWFEFNREWLQNINKHNILCVRYEDLKTDFDSTLHQIAAFLSFNPNAETIARVKARASFEFMKLHETKFGEQPPESKHAIVYDNFIRKGELGEGGKYMSEEQVKLFMGRLIKNLSGFKEMQPYLESLKQTSKQEIVKHHAIKEELIAV